MYDVVLFGGTDEGHKIADFLSEKNISCIVCVATAYGAEILNGKNVRAGRMNAEEMRIFFEESDAEIVVDATHPYAENVTENIKKANPPRYIRVMRGDTKTDGGGRSFPDLRSAAQYLKKTHGNILLTTGSKEISEFSALSGRSYARVLPSAESLKLCAEAGFGGRRVICMQGPFSREFNAALMRELEIKYLVTKRSGKSGGFTEKIDGARDAGAECIIIERPSGDAGVTVEEAENLILEWL